MASSIFWSPPGQWRSGEEPRGRSHAWMPAEMNRVDTISMQVDLALRRRARRHDGGDVTGRSGRTREDRRSRRTTRRSRCRDSGNSLAPSSRPTTQSPPRRSPCARPPDAPSFAGHRSCRSRPGRGPRRWPGSRRGWTVSGVPSSFAATCESAAAVRRRTRSMPSRYGRLAAMRAWARTIREAAMSSIALVIFLVDCTLRIRRRRMRSWPPAMNQSTFPVSNVSRNAVNALSISSPSGRALVERMVSRTDALFALRYSISSVAEAPAPRSPERCRSSP